MSLLVHAPVQVLQKGEVGGEQLLDHPRRYLVLAQRAEAGDHPGKQDHGEVALVLADARVAQRQDLVLRSGEPHETVPMDDVGIVDVAPRQLERELRSERLRLCARGFEDCAARGHAGAMPSCVMVHSSTSTSLPPACSDASETFEGQAFKKLNRLFSPPA